MSARQRQLEVGGAVLGGHEIERRAPDIFLPGTWDATCVQEAAYELRVSGEFAVVGEQVYMGDQTLPEGVDIQVACGDIAVLSTVEIFSMPISLAGRMGIRFKFSRKGLLPLFGPQLDPLYGNPHGERLYLTVCNVSTEPIAIRIGEPVFKLELYPVLGEVKRKTRPSVADQMRALFGTSRRAGRLGFIVKLEDDLRRTNEELKTIRADVDKAHVAMGAMERGTQQVVLFGIFLVAATLFGAIVTLTLSLLFNLASALNQAAATSWMFQYPWLAAAVAIVTVIAFLTMLGLLLRWMLAPVRPPGNVPKRQDMNQP